MLELTYLNMCDTQNKGYRFMRIFIFRSGFFMCPIFFVTICLISGLRTCNKRNLDTICVAICYYGATAVGVLFQLDWLDGLWRFS